MTAAVSEERPDLGPPEGLEEQRVAIRRFMAEFVEPALDEWEESGIAPIHSVIARLSEAGLMGMRFRNGTTGDGLWRHVALIEELGRLPAAGLGLAIMAHADMVLPLLAGHVSAEIREGFFDPGLAGRAVFSRELAAPAGREGGSPLLVAHRQSDAYVVNGVSRFVVNAAMADAHCVLAAVTDAPSPADVVILMAPAHLPGIEVGPSFQGLGHRSASIAAEVRFNEVRIPVEHLVGEPQAMSCLALHSQHERLLAACRATAAAGLYLQAATEHCRSRVAFGAPLAGHQAVRLRLAELRTKVEASQRLNYAAVQAWVAAPDRDLTGLSAAAKLKAGRLARWVAEECLALHGARGYMYDHPASRFARDARLFSTANGSEAEMLAALTRSDGSVVTDSTKSPLGEAHESFRSAVAGVVRSALQPQVASWNSSAGENPIREALNLLAGEGCLGIGFSAAEGGAGGDLWHSVVLHEELASLRSSVISTAVLSHLEVGTRLVIDHGSPAARERWAPAALRGEVVLGYAATEDSAGSDLAATTTSARRDGASWVMDGRKKFITNAAQADALCVLARTSDRGITSHTLFVVPTAEDGVSVSELSSMGNQGTLGEVSFEGVRLDQDSLLGLEGQGLLLQIRRLAHERAFVAIILSAMADAALRALISQFRAPSEALAFRLGELVADVEQARRLAYHSIAVVAAGQDARTAAAMAKLTASQAFRNVTDEALDLLGLQAQAEGSATAVAYCDAMGFAFAGGADNMLLEAIAR